MEEHLIKEVIRRYKRMPVSLRVSKIKELISKSPDHRKVIQRDFPELYREAESNPDRVSGGGLSEQAQTFELCAKPH
jgi:hypothetical protein